MKKTIAALLLITQSSGAIYASESAMDALKAQVPPSVLENSAVRPPLDPPAFRRYLVDQGVIKLDSFKPAHKITWSTLTILRFIPKTALSKAGGLIVDDGQNTWAGHMAAARKIDIVLVEIRGAAQVDGINQVREIAKALSGQMTLKDFADRMDVIYVFPKDTARAEAKVPMPAHKAAWSALTTLRFIPKTALAKAGGLVVNDGQSTWEGHVAAARQIDMVFMEAYGVSQIDGIDQIREISKALSGQMTFKDFADRMDVIYVFPKDAPRAAAKASKGKSAMICFYNGTQLAHSGNCQEAVMEYQIENEGYSFELDTGGSRGNCYLNDAAGHRVQSVHESYCGLTDADFAPGGRFGRADDGGNTHPED